jgi:voltage-gated potassium channel
MATRTGLFVIRHMGLRKLASSWQEKSNIPMAIIGLVYLAAYSLQVVYSSDVTLVEGLEVVSQVIWFVFAIDVFIRLIGTDNFLKFLRGSWLELLALAIPFVRILRVFRVVLALRGIRGFVTNRASEAGSYIVMLVPLTWFAGGIAVLDAESTNPDSSITNLREALWWSLATITTVGYGDKYPTTFEGQLVAAVLMLAGIALFSAGAGIFASWVLGEKKKAED